MSRFAPSLALSGAIALTFGLGSFYATDALGVFAAANLTLALVARFALDPPVVWVAQGVTVSLIEILALGGRLWLVVDLLGPWRPVCGG